MEEAPNLANNFEPEPRATPDPEKIGDLLLRYEMPAKKQPELGVQESSVEITHEQLNPIETPPDLVDLPESHFDSRHEVVSQDDTPVAAVAKEVPAKQEAIKNDPLLTTPDNSAKSSPPLYVPPDQSSVTVNSTASPYKKPVVYGLLAGAVIGITLLYIYLR